LTGALGGHRGSGLIRFGRSPGRLVKDRPKEPHDGVVSERLAPKPVSKKRKLRDKSPKVTSVRKPERPKRRSRPHQGVDEYLNRLIDGGEPRTRAPKVKRPWVKVKYQKWDLTQESWNFKRSPRLKKLRKSLNQVIKGNNAFYKFKAIFANVKISTPGEYNRYMSILSEGLLVTARPIGIRITPLIRKVRNLSYQDLEFLISKLPFWATSYETAKIHKLALAIRFSQSNGRSEANLSLIR
jgi:hypothetical protein